MKKLQPKQSTNREAVWIRSGGWESATKLQPVSIVLQMGVLAERVGTWLRSGVGAA